MTINKQRQHRQWLLAAPIICTLILANALFIMSTKAASPYHATISTSNFTLQTLEVGADDMNDPSHVAFHLQNGSPFWYGITVQSTPSGITPTAANQSGDLVTSTFARHDDVAPARRYIALRSVKWNVYL